MTDQFRNSNFSSFQQNLPNATAALVLGILSIVGAICYGIFGVILGIIGLVLANKDRKLYESDPGLYAAASYSTSNAGRVCSIIGVVIGGIFLLFFGLIVAFNLMRSVRQF